MVLGVSSMRRMLRPIGESAPYAFSMILSLVIGHMRVPSAAAPKPVICWALSLEMVRSMLVCAFVLAVAARARVAMIRGLLGRDSVIGICLLMWGNGENKRE